MAVPGSVTPLCQEFQEEREFLKNGLFNPFTWHCLLSQVNGLLNPFTCEGHTSVLTESFARNLWTWWVLPALVFSAVS